MVYALIFPVTVGLVFAWMELGLPTPRCAFHEITGFPCLTCGTTRAVGSLLRGDWIQAIRWNPAVSLAGLALTLGWIYSIMVWLFRLRRFRPAVSPRIQFGLRVAIVILGIANWIYLIRVIP